MWADTEYLATAVKVFTHSNKAKYRFVRQPSE